MNNTQQTAAQAMVQDKQTKGAVKTMTNKALDFTLINSKEVVVASTREKVAFPVQVRMTLEVGGKTQTVAFGFNRLGGRQTYIAPEGKAPQKMSRADFMKTLRSHNILNVKQVESFLARITPFYKDDLYVAKCDCCKTGLVTAANVDYVQRNHEKMTEKLGQPVTAFSKLCYTCQGRPAQKQQKPAPSVPATAQKATCSHCNKDVSQKVAQFSLKTHGRILCFKPCQSKYPKLNTQAGATSPQQAPAPAPQQPAQQQPVQQQSVPQAPVQDAAPSTGEMIALTPSLVRELMALEVDRYSEIGQLQEQLRPMHLDYSRQENSLWKAMNEEQVARSASEASAPLSHVCAVCETTMPHAADVCPPCAEELKTWDKIGKKAGAVHPYNQCEECGVTLPSFDDHPYTTCKDCGIGTKWLSDFYEEGKQVGEPGVCPASEASMDRQDKEDVAPSAEDTKEVPQAESTDETVCKSPGSDVLSNVTVASRVLTEDEASFLHEIAYEPQDADVPPLPEEPASSI